MQPVIPCFVKDTPVETDQGTFAIQELRKKSLKYSINNQKIMGVSKTNNSSGNFICIEKNAIAENVPNMTTITTKNHLIENNKGKLVKAKSLVNGTTITKQYLGEQYVYNILLNEHSLIKINNMGCETLNPKNLGAQKMLKKSKMALKKKTIIQ